MAVGDDLQTVGVVHRVIGGEKNFRSDEDKERSETKQDPHDRFESGTIGGGLDQGGRCHHSPLKCIDVMTGATKARNAGNFILETVINRVS